MSNKVNEHEHCHQCERYRFMPKKEEYIDLLVFVFVLLCIISFFAKFWEWIF